MSVQAEQVELEGMPEPGVLRRVVVEGVAVVIAGRSLVYRCEVDDLGMWSLAVVALTDAGRRVDEVAAVFDLTATYVSMLRGRAARQGSAGLARRRGRPAKLDGRQRARAARWAGQGRSQEWIAEQFGVARSVIGRVLVETGPVGVQDELETEDAVTDEAGQEGTTQVEEPAGQGAAERAGQGAAERSGQSAAEPVAPRGGFGAGDHRDAAVPVCRGDAAAFLTGAGGCRAGLRDGDRWPGPAL